MSTPEVPLPSPPPPPPSQPQLQTRRVPPPCWTHEETLALIEAYRDRWIELRRGYLRTADWDSVADSVSQKCRHLTQTADKSSAQCRHKIEKLRQRYRAERQRCISFPGKFFSSWIFFKKLDFIDDASSSAPGSDQTPEMKIGKGKFRVKTKSTVDRNSNEIGLGGSKNGNSNPNVDYNHDFDNGGGDGFILKSTGDRPSVFTGSTYYGKIDGNSCPNFDDYHVRSSALPPPPGFKAKKNGKPGGRLNSSIDYLHQNDDELNIGGEFVDNQTAIPLNFRPNTYSKIIGSANPYFPMDHDMDNEISTGPRFHERNSGYWHMFPHGIRSKNPNFIHGDSSSFNGHPLRTKFAEKSGGGGDGDGSLKRERDPVLEIISSIKHLGDGFIKMEKMKMDMAMEIEKMRMEMEIKRNETILESQRQIVDAFLRAFSEKNSKAKFTVSTES